MKEQGFDSNKALIEYSLENVLFSWLAQGGAVPLPMVRAKGVHFWDVEGKRYIDFSSQLMNVNAGHQHPTIIEAVKKQTEQLYFGYPGMATEPKARLAAKLAELTPGTMSKSFFTLGGAEAVENAIKIARLVTGRNKIVTRYRSYHGATLGAMTASGDPRRLAVEPGIPGVVRVMDPYCYRCPFGQQPETCHRECIKHVEEVITFEGPENVAAILMEGVTGSSGIILPPDDYWPRLREFADRHGILLIDDEVMSGFGRTGKWFGIDHYGVEPDLMTLSKGITGAAVPLGAVTVSKKIADHFDENVLWCGLTCSGHPVSCAAGLGAIQAYEEDGMIENARLMGERQTALLEQAKERHPSVGDVRNLGLFGVIELVKNRETREPMAPWNATASEMGVMSAVGAKLRELGMFTFVRWNWIFTVPPLCITEAELQEGFDIIEQALTVADTGVC